MTFDDPLAPLARLSGVAEAVDATRAAMDGLLREPALRRRRGEVRAAARVHSAWASASLAGSEVGFESFTPPFADDGSGRLAAAALQLASEVGAVADIWRHAPLQALARLHTVATASWAEVVEPGRPRSTPGVSERLTALARVVSATSVSGVIVAAVVHGELMSLRPFGAADDLVARAAAHVVLVQSGVDPDAVTVPEMGLLDLGADAYADAVGQYATGEPEGVTQWITFQAASVQRGISFARTLCR